MEVKGGVKMEVKGEVKGLLVVEDDYTGLESPGTGLARWSMVKNAIEREQSQACLSYAEREHFRRSQCSMVNVQWSMK